MVAYSCVGVSGVTIRLQYARIAESTSVVRRVAEPRMASFGAPSRGRQPALVRRSSLRVRCTNAHIRRETIVLTVLCALGFSARTRRKAGLASAAAEVPRDCDGTRADVWPCAAGGQHVLQFSNFVRSAVMIQRARHVGNSGEARTKIGGIRSQVARSALDPTRCAHTAREEVRKDRAHCASLSELCDKFIHGQLWLDRNKCSSLPCD